ncbi:diguanylate cyclase (GGDEF) domain-containing protein [Hoeflea sp. IMCC20628]|uniref:putative bifunctional diguanylate cyclase/phosphodiesterase n=1 Tax=Hoeflea sp. IMCC20628 TaxID=1620421 RepID=UPI00063ABF54|nr:EAL domain-containing protein [Hoeflea sp. IMCC20628]AKH99564.1 diguanylate cyclase (GGDEF) domain-containing protein [Hoeflea sp. IMCC20628]
MMLNSYLPNKSKRYAIVGLAIASITPLAALAGEMLVGVGGTHTGFETTFSALGIAAVAAPIAVTGLIAGLGRRHDRLAQQIGSERAAAERFRKAAYHDSLTGLRNRHALTEDFDQIAARMPGQSAAMTLMLFDLDRFKFINDTMGHAAGDAVLKALAERLQAYCGDSRRVYRLGGDEFVILWEGTHSTDEITRFCAEFSASVFRPVVYGDGAIDTFCSVGIAMTDGPAATLSDLLKRADLALYRAKSKPGSNHCFYSVDMDNDYQNRRGLEAAMRAAVATSAFELEYLPVIKTATLSPSGFRASLRWNHPDLGNIEQAAFMPLAEQSGLIVLIGKWMLRQALGDVGKITGQAEITLPVSPLQLQDQGFAPLVAMELKHAGVAPERLVIDVTSNAAMGKCPVALTNLELLRSAGVRIAVSEFAASVAGLSMGRPYPVDRVRLNLAGIKAIAGEKQMPQMLNLFLQLAATVGTLVTLTGVDSVADLQCALKAGAEEVEGSFAGPALSAERARQFFTSLAGLAPAQPDSSDLRKAG